MIACPDCGHIGGGHGLVHVRHGNGGGRNVPCPRGERHRMIEALSEAEAKSVLFYLSGYAPEATTTALTWWESIKTDEVAP